MQALNPELVWEIVSAIVAGVVWICGGVTALVVFTWKISRRIQRLLDQISGLEERVLNHEKRLRRVEKINNVLQFPK